MKRLLIGCVCDFKFYKRSITGTLREVEGRIKLLFVAVCERFIH